MDTLWRTAFERGGQGWPSVELRYEDFYERLKALGYGEDALPEHVDAVYVCAASARGEDAACRAIEERHFPGLRAAIARVDGRKDFLDEVLQLLRVHLFSGPTPKISSYTGRGPLSRWLKTAALRIAFRQKKASALHLASMPDSPDPAAAPTVVSRRDEANDRPFQNAYAHAFEGALREAFRGLHGRERAVLRLHFAEGMNIDEIGRVYAVHRTTVARWIATSRDGLARTVRGRLEAQFGQLTQDEFDSLFRLVYEQLDLSVTALLRNSVQFAGIAAAELASEK
jgi:RNA polymerase sigma-70 factor (ECF subfamily)